MALILITSARGIEEIPDWPDLYRWPIGPETWRVCDDCNFNTHYCHGCGEEMTHGEMRGVNYDRHIRDAHPELVEEFGL